MRKYKIIQKGSIQYNGENLLFRNWEIFSSGKPPYKFDDAFAWLLKELKRGYISNKVFGDAK